MSERPDLAIMMFDYAPSGVVRNALRIAGAGQEAGLRTEVWTAQRVGEMVQEIPRGVEARSLGIDLGDPYSLRDRKRALVRVSAPLARMMVELRPRLLLSAGNHFHKPAVAAIDRVDPQAAPRLIGRVSNALPRFSWWPAKLPNSLIKRINARRRYQMMDRLIAVSEQVRRDLQTKLLVDPSKITVIPNGIDLAEVERLGREPMTHEWFDPGQPPVIIGTGRLTHQKGFDVLLRAFALARARRPMRLIILGKGPEQGRLQALAEHLGIDADVQLRGHVDNPLPYLRRAALFVLPSRWEGLSNALLEALASGTPMVATRCTGSTELLDRGRYGTLVRVGDVGALAESIVEALGKERPGDYDQRLRAKEYDLTSTLQSYVQLFQEELVLAGAP
jgi:glycosyltransferase involved in cell wall biosynthesis